MPLFMRLEVGSPVLFVPSCPCRKGLPQPTTYAERPQPLSDTPVRFFVGFPSASRSPRFRSRIPGSTRAANAETGQSAAVRQTLLKPAVHLVLDEPLRYVARRGRIIRMTMVRCIRRIPNRYNWDSGDASSPSSSHSAARCSTYCTWSCNGAPVLRATMSTSRSSRYDNHDEVFSREENASQEVQVRREDNVVLIEGRMWLRCRGGGCGFRRRWKSL